MGKGRRMIVAWGIWMATFGPEIGFTPLTPAIDRPHVFAVQNNFLHSAPKLSSTQVCVLCNRNKNCATDVWWWADGRVWMAGLGTGHRLFVTASLIGMVPCEVHANIGAHSVRTGWFMMPWDTVLPAFCLKTKYLKRGTNRGVIPFVPSYAQKRRCDVHWIISDLNSSTG